MDVPTLNPVRGKYHKYRGALAQLRRVTVLERDLQSGAPPLYKNFAHGGHLRRKLVYNSSGRKPELGKRPRWESLGKANTIFTVWKDTAQQRIRERSGAWGDIMNLLKKLKEKRRGTKNRWQ